MKTSGRILGFDLLRGICALAIMFHHLLGWETGDGLYNIGTYGVYIFFILSGASITIAYADKMVAGMKYSTFIIRRYLRLAPLYWLIVLSRGAFGVKFGDALLNISFLFGFANPGLSGWAGGGWSLGIEFVFYFCFPIFLVITASKSWRWAFLAPLMAMQILFVHGIIIHDSDMIAQRGEYTQFAAFMGYFMIGCCIGRLFIEPPIFRLNQALCWMAFTFLLALVAILCIFSDYTVLGAGLGLYLTICCGFLVLLAGCLRIPPRIEFIAASAGAMSYGVYLLHFRIYAWLKLWPALKIHGEFGFIMIVAAVTICAALLIEKYFEKPIRELRFLSSSQRQRFLRTIEFPHRA